MSTERRGGMSKKPVVVELIHDPDGEGLRYATRFQIVSGPRVSGSGYCSFYRNRRTGEVEVTVELSPVLTEKVPRRAGEGVEFRTVYRTADEAAGEIQALHAVVVDPTLVNGVAYSGFAYEHREAGGTPSWVETSHLRRLNGSYRDTPSEAASAVITEIVMAIREQLVTPERVTRYDRREAERRRDEAEAAYATAKEALMEAEKAFKKAVQAAARYKSEGE